MESWLMALLSEHGIDAVSYQEIWRNGGDTSRAQRASVKKEIETVEAVVLDLSDSAISPLAALALGMAVALDKNSVTIADVDADVNNVQAPLRYSTEDDEAKALFVSALRETLANPASAADRESSTPEVFISYSHADAEYLARLRVHLHPLERAFNIRTWSDTDIRPGSSWREEVAGALDRANIAVLLVSADFLASEFITTNELPPLLKKARSRGAVILPLILTRCRFTRDPDLSAFQAVNDPSHPLSSLPLEDREEFYDKVAAEIEALMQEPGTRKT